MATWVENADHTPHFNGINIISTNTKFEGSGVKKITTISKPHEQEEIPFEVSEFVSVNFNHSKNFPFSDYSFLNYQFKVHLLLRDYGQGRKETAGFKSLHILVTPYILPSIQPIYTRGPRKKGSQTGPRATGGSQEVPGDLTRLCPPQTFTSHFLLGGPTFFSWENVS